MEQPLTVLREDLARLGFARREGVHEPEDHVAALCEVMAMLVADPERAVDYARQRAFFESHLDPFQGRFWNDLAAAGSARFYTAVGRLGMAFSTLEKGYFSLPA
jgi:TorA maturation chaperone TorD